jgi:transposase
MFEPVTGSRSRVESSIAYYHIVNERVPFRELGPDWLARRHSPEHRTRRLANNSKRSATQSQSRPPPDHLTQPTSPTPRSSPPPDPLQRGPIRPRTPPVFTPQECHEEGPPAERCSARPRETKGGRCNVVGRIGSEPQASRLHLLDDEGATVDAGAAPPDADGLHRLSQRLERHRAPIRAAIESMNGARFVHDRLELAGWQVEIADAQKVKGLAPLACKTDRIDAWVLAELARRDLVPAIWLPDPRVRAERERARWRLHLVRHRSSLKQRVHAVLLTYGTCPVSDLFGVSGRQLLARLGLPEPWQGTIEASLRLIDELDREIGHCERELRRLGADHHYVPLLLTVPGISWVLAYTIAAELGDIDRFPTPRKLVGYSGLRPRVYQSGARDLRGPLAKQGTTLSPLGAGRGRHPRLHPPRLPRPLSTNEGAYRQAARRQSGPDRPRPPPRRSDLAHAHPQPTFAPKGATDPLAGPLGDAPPERTPIGLVPLRGGDREMSPARHEPPQHPP